MSKMEKNTNVQINKNTKITIESELALYRRTGNSTHARTIADRIVLALELGNIDRGFLLGLDTRLQLVPSGGNLSSPLGGDGQMIGGFIKAMPGAVVDMEDLVNDELGGKL